VHHGNSAKIGKQDTALHQKDTKMLVCGSRSHASRETEIGKSQARGGDKIIF